MIDIDFVVSPSVVDAVIHAVPPRRASIEPSGLTFTMLSSEEEKLKSLMVASLSRVMIILPALPCFILLLSSLLSTPSNPICHSFVRTSFTEITTLS